MLQTLASIGLRDLFEIVVVWAFFYYIFIRIRGTRAVNVLKGLAVLLIITFVADFLQLQLIPWMMNKLWTTFIIILVILFHPEIRRALTRFGQLPFLNFYEREPNERVVEEVVKAAQKMSALRIGALIVFEREMGLKAYVDTGVRIDARVTAELILTVFHPKTPLHDGAIIIAGDSLVAASCILPLPPEDMAIDSKYGTRHRAAIGLSLETDAGIVVISEETGTISIVLRGKLTTDLTPESLQEMLTIYVKGSGELPA